MFGSGFMSRGDSEDIICRASALILVEKAPLGYLLDKPRCRQDSVRNSSPYTTHYIASALFSIIPI